MTPAEEVVLAQSVHTTNELYLAELGEFEDDPAADDVYIFALKMNENLIRLDDTVSKCNNNTLELEMLRERGLFGAAAYGGRLGTPSN
jgi:hypothetical protein